MNDTIHRDTGSQNDTDLRTLSRKTILRDLTSGTVVFFVALPLCLGVALASEAPLFSGLLAGIVGGVLVGALSGSHTSVAGPAAGLTAVIAAEISGIGSYRAFLLAVVLAGVIQVLMGTVRLGFLAAFFPSAVIKGLLAAIGVILILKQIPHVVGHDTDPEGEMSFEQPDHETTFSELGLLLDMHPGAAAIGLLSFAVLIFWDNFKPLRKSPVPAPIVVVLLGVGLRFLFRQLGERWAIEEAHLVQVPIATSFGELAGFLQWPDFSRLGDSMVLTAAVTIALVASLETLLNLEAVDKLDPRQRSSPASRELVAQGIGNVVIGLLGGIPVTSVIVRSSVNILSGAQTKLSTIFHGLLLLVSVVFLPAWLNQIPISCLAAILLATGIKLASPTLVREMWAGGKYQFVPFAVTLVAIVLTDLLVGILIGLAVSTSFILASNVRRPVRRYVEKHLGGDVLHIELANQVSFLNRASLTKTLDSIPRGGHVLLDAQNTDFIDPDVLDMLRDFKEHTAPAKRIQASFLGFRTKYRIEDRIQYVDYSTRDLQTAITPAQVLQVLKEGHERFLSGRRLTRDLARQVSATADGQHPLAVVLSCIDSRTPAELIFDLGMGDIFSVRVAGNSPSRKVLGSIEYGCAVAGAKLVLVMGHTRCGAVATAVRLACSSEPPERTTGCEHIGHVLQEIQKSCDHDACRHFDRLSANEREQLVTSVARRNVIRTVRALTEDSTTLSHLALEGRIAVMGALYDVVSGDIAFLEEPARGNAVDRAGAGAREHSPSFS